MDTVEDSGRHQTLLAEFRDGRRAALARAISIVEDGRPGFQTVLDALHPHLGRARRVGITGPPGAGKSTLTAALIRRFRDRGDTVGVVAVDPTSPYTGGALLGDRIRMGEVATDPGVFIRSMATRGSLGGLAPTTREVIDVMDAFGFDHILVETVGVGQAELAIAAAADTTVVVLVPESGDSIQAMKAGLMEISDLFVVNKADRPGSERLARDVQLMLRLKTGRTMRNVPAHHGVDLDRARRAGEAIAGTAGGEEGERGDEGATPRTGDAADDAPGADADHARPEPWSIPVLRTTAETGDGVDELVETLERHRTWLEASGALEERRGRRLAERVRDAVARRLDRITWAEREGDAVLAAALPELEAGTTTPYEVAARIVRAVVG